jgi:beta-ureidopropionase / N-carbamoyl-L-amino-acid hydrolase
MSVRRDEAGNSIAVLPGREPALRPIAAGSHTDTVPEGGRYDGALGVVGALACVRALQRSGVRLRHPLALINFEAEEATMAGATFGSRAFVGNLDPGIINRPAFDGATVKSHLERAGLDPDTVTEAAVGPESLAAFLELHVEQGPVLDAAGIPIGIVGASRASAAMR